MADDLPRIAGVRGSVRQGRRMTSALNHALGREATAELMRHRHESTAHALEMAIRRAYKLGRVDQSIEVAGIELRRMVEADPGITPWRVLRMYGVHPGRWSNVPGWDEVLWRVADVWCEVYRRLQGRPAPELPASPYSVLSYALPAREAAATQR